MKIHRKLGDNDRTKNEEAIEIEKKTAMDDNTK